MATADAEVTPIIDLRTSGADPFACTCNPRDLFLGGCKCGAVEMEKLCEPRPTKDCERDAMRRFFFGKPPTPPVTFRQTCSHCGKTRDFHTGAQGVLVCEDGRQQWSPV